MSKTTKKPLARIPLKFRVTEAETVFAIEDMARYASDRNAKWNWNPGLREVTIFLLYPEHRNAVIERAKSFGWWLIVDLEE